MAHGVFEVEEVSSEYTGFRACRAARVWEIARMNGYSNDALAGDVGTAGEKNGVMCLQVGWRPPSLAPEARR